MRRVSSAGARRALVFVALCPPASSQPPPVPEAPGLLVSGDFDGDGRDDAVLFGVLGANVTLLGQRNPPFLRRGAAGPTPHMWNLVATPVTAGPYLYLPTRGAAGSRTVDVHRFAGGGWQLVRRIPVPPTRQGRRVVGLRLTRFHEDCDRDGIRDVYAAWTERPERKRIGAWTGVLTPSGLLRRRPVLRRSGQPAGADLVALQPVTAPGAARTPDYLLMWSGDRPDPAGGFGFQLGPPDGTGIWRPGLPTIDSARFVHTATGVHFGRFARGSTALAALVALRSGHLLLLPPKAAPPYLSSRFQSFDVGRRFRWIGTEAVDFDGDGRDELAFVRSEGTRHLTEVVVASPQRPGSRVWRFDLGDGIHETSVFDGVQGADFDGDGTPDLLLSHYRDGNPRRGGLALFTGTGGPVGRAPIRPRY